MSKFCSIKIPPHDPCSTSLSAALCEAHASSQPSIGQSQGEAQDRECLDLHRCHRSRERTFCTQGTDDGMKQNIIWLQLAAEFFRQLKMSGQQARAHYLDLVSELFRQLIRIPAASNQSEPAEWEWAKEFVQLLAEAEPAINRVTSWLQFLKNASACAQKLKTPNETSETAIND